MTEKEMVQMILDENLVPLEIFYQEMRDAGDNHLLSYRARTFLRSPELGLLGPEEYGVTAERSMLAVSVFLWSLRQVCREIGKMQQNGMDVMSFITIPVPMKAIGTLDFAATLKTAFEKENFTFFNMICLELPGQAVYEELDVLHTLVTELHEMGVKVIIRNVGDANYPVARLAGLGLDYAILEDKLAAAFLDDDADRMAVMAMISYLKAIETRILIPNVERGDDPVRSRIERAGCAGYVITSTDGMSFSQLLEQKLADEA